jgi:hypothetical protein
MSQFEWLAGKRLPEVFQTHFCAHATASTADGSHNTPYVRFALATLGELHIKHNGKSYAAGTIARALTRARTPRARAVRPLRGAKRKKRK